MIKKLVILAAITAPALFSAPAFNAAKFTSAKSAHKVSEISAAQISDTSFSFDAGGTLRAMAVSKDGDVVAIEIHDFGGFLVKATDAIVANKVTLSPNTMSELETAAKNIHLKV